MKTVFGICIITLLLVSCAPSRFVRPLKKDQQSINAHLGGPLIGFAGTTIPIPFTSFTYGRGISDKITAFGSLHTTSLLFGVVQTDIGACYRLHYFDSARVGISLNPALNLSFDKWEKHFRCWPQLDMNAYWEIKKEKSFVYAGVENWFELSKYGAHGRPQNTHWIFCPQAGITLVKNKWNYTFETKYIAPNKPNLPNVVDYRGIHHKGAIGIYLGFTRTF